MKLNESTLTADLASIPRLLGFRLGVYLGHVRTGLALGRFLGCNTRADSVTTF